MVQISSPPTIELSKKKSFINKNHFTCQKKKKKIIISPVIVRIDIGIYGN